MTQLNTPYPSTAYLTGFLRSRGFEAVQEDLALALVLRLLSRQGLAEVAAAVDLLPSVHHTQTIEAFVEQRARYSATIEPVIAFLQGRDSTLAHRIASRQYLPEGPRFASLDVYVDDEGGDPLAWAFGALGLTTGSYTWTWGSGANAGSAVLTIGAVPEPSTYALAAIATGVMAAVARRRKARKV
jgi:hypothetical protein